MTNIKLTVLAIALFATACVTDDVETDTDTDFDGAGELQAPKGDDGNELDAPLGDEYDGLEDFEDLEELDTGRPMPELPEHTIETVRVPTKGSFDNLHTESMQNARIRMTDRRRMGL